MAEILYAPDRERVLTSNAWAFLHWLRVARGMTLDDWPALQRWSVSDPPAFSRAVATFAGLPDAPLRLARQSGAREALVLRRQGGERIALTRDDTLAASSPGTARLPPDVAAPLARTWPPAALIRPLAEILLHADLRPDDRVLVVGLAWPWLAALVQGTAVILAAPTAADLLPVAAEERATVVVSPATLLAEAAFQRPRRRPNLGCLRAIVATGGPLSPEGSRRIYTWVKSDLMLLARTGDTFWGNPLEPVLARPPAAPAFLTPPVSAPATG